MSEPEPRPGVSGAVLRAAIADFIEQARAQMQQQPQLSEAPENPLQAMLAAQRQDGTFTDAEVVGNLHALPLAWKDTTVHTLAWTIWFLAPHPDIQVHLAREAKCALAMIARNFELELDDSRGPVKESFCFTMVPKGLRVRLTERSVPRRPTPLAGAAPGCPAHPTAQPAGMGLADR